MQDVSTVLATCQVSHSEGLERATNRTEIIVVVVHLLITVLPDVDVVAARWDLGYPCVTVLRGVVGARDPLAGGIVAPAYTADIEFRRRV